MIKVVRKLKMYQTECECPKCKSLLQFEHTDIKEYSENYHPSYNYITCPTDSHRITLPDNLDSIEIKSE